MNKQLLSFLLTVLMSMVGTKSFAYDIAAANDDGFILCYSWRNNYTELSVSAPNYSNYSGSIVIPESVEYNGNTYPVTSIGSFNGCSSMTSITIPPSINYIEEDAFGGCTSLISVYISDLEAWCKIRCDECAPNEQRR